MNEDFDEAAGSEDNLNIEENLNLRLNAKIVEGDESKSDEGSIVSPRNV